MLPRVKDMGPEASRAAYDAYLDSTLQSVNARFQGHNRADLREQFAYLETDLRGIENAIDDWNQGSPETVTPEDAAMLGRVAALRSVVGGR